MPLSSATYLSEDALAKWLIEAFAQRITIAPFWQFRGIEGGALEFGEYGSTFSGGQQLTNATTPISDATLSPTAQTKFSLAQVFATRYRISYFDQDRLTVPNNLDAVEAAVAVRQLLYAYFEALPGWLNTMVDPTMTLDMSGNPMTMYDLDRAYSLIRENGGRPNFIVSSDVARRQYIYECRLQGYLPEYITIKMRDPIHGWVDAKVPALHGTPWLVNDYMFVDGAPADIWFMVMGDSQRPDPEHGITGIIPANRVGEMFVRRETSDGQYINVDYTWPAGIAMGSKGSLSLYRFNTTIA